jgi:exodeoxyribonuclease VII small subunit
VTAAGDTAASGKADRAEAGHAASTAGASTAGASTAGASTAGASTTRRPGYEQARDELTELVKRLEAGGLTLEQSLQLWERGEQLAAICEEWLEGARARLATALARQEDEAE